LINWIKSLKNKNKKIGGRGFYHFFDKNAPGSTSAGTQPGAPAGTQPGAQAGTQAGAPPGTTQAGNAGAGKAGSFSGADMAFVISGKTVRLDQNVSVIKDLLGAPKSCEEVESCAYDGLDKFFVYDGVEVSTLPIDGDLICAIDVLKNTVKTEKGVTIGGSLAQIEAAYGKDYTLENGVLIYWAGPKGNPKTPQLYFMLDRNDNVKTFGMYNGKSAG